MPSPTDGVCSRGFPTAWFWTFNFANAKTKGIFAIFTCLSYAYAWYNQLHNGVPFSPWALNACTGWTTLMKWTLIPFCFTLIISIVTSSLIYCLLIKTFHQISCSFLPDRAIIYLFFFFWTRVFLWPEFYPGRPKIFHSSLRLLDIWSHIIAAVQYCWLDSWTSGKAWTYTHEDWLLILVLIFCTSDMQHDVGHPKM